MNGDTRACPLCGETILANSARCEYCQGEIGGPTEAEEILADVMANLFRGIEGVGGRIKITSRRVLFQPHAFNIQTSPAAIPLCDIVEVRKRNTMGLIPNGLLIRTKSGEEYKFVVWKRQKLISLIESRIKKA